MEQKEIIEGRDEIGLKFGDFKYSSLKNSPETARLVDKLNDPEYDDESKRKELLIEIIQSFDGKIYSWWDGGYFPSKESAIEYIRTYNNQKSNT